MKVYEDLKSLYSLLKLLYEELKSISEKQILD